MIAFVEGLDRDFPVAVEDRRLAPVIVHAADVVRIEIGLRRGEMLLEADAVGVQIDIDPAAPAPELDGHEVEIVVGQGFGGPFVTVDDFRDSAVELPRPAGIFAEEAGGVAAALGDRPAAGRTEEHTSELPSLMRISF